MTGVTGKPELMKRMNTTLLYRTLIRLGSATRAEVANETNLSATTIRNLFEELEAGGEIVAGALDRSSRRSARPAVRPQPGAQPDPRALLCRGTDRLPNYRPDGRRRRGQLHLRRGRRHGGSGPPPDRGLPFPLGRPRGRARRARHRGERARLYRQRTGYPGPERPRGAGPFRLPRSARSGKRS